MGTDQYGNGYNGGYGGDYLGVPFLFRNIDMSYNATKEVHDSYNVYVNRDFIGSKALVTQVENVDDIRKFLVNQGFSDFSTSLEGKEYYINTDNRESVNLKHAVEVYLNNR